MLTADVAGPLRAAPPTTAELEAAYDHCWRIARAHYENFPLGSWLLPRPLRRHVAAIYAFARTLDDLADEGTAPAAERLDRLEAWEVALEAAFAGSARHPILVALADTAARFELGADPFWRLLAAFRADVAFRPFPTFAALRAYCANSADPVGHLVLGLFGYRDEPRRALADEICTGLQLANFWQDVAIDAAKGRLYVPAEDLDRFGCRADDLMRGVSTAACRDLMAFEVERTRRLLAEGLELALTVDRRLAREVLLFGWAGLEVLRAIEAVDYDVFARRPTVSGRRKLALVARALVTRTGGSA
jgi:squalene synthase HpnC